jgi:hypothetical protein
VIELGPWQYAVPPVWRYAMIGGASVPSPSSRRGGGGCFGAGGSLSGVYALSPVAR